jgi:hypothetical protein
MYAKTQSQFTIEVNVKKHLQLGLGLLAVSTAMYADSATDQNADQNKPTYTKTDVYLSSPSWCFEAFGSALLMQPYGSNLHYAAEAQPLPVQSPNWKIHEIRPDYHWGFDVGIAGLFHCTNSKLSLDWERLHSTDTASRTVSPDSNMIGPMFEIGPDAAPYKKARGKVNFQFDQVNLDYGTFINFGDRLQTNFFGGLSFARIYEKISAKFWNQGSFIIREVKVPSTFWGIGPQIGMDINYKIVKGFHLTGGIVAELLVGPQKNHTDYFSQSPELTDLGFPNPNNQSTKDKKKTQVVPGVEGNIGLAYTVEFWKHCMFNIEAGYDVQVFFNAIQSIDMGSEVDNVDIVTASGGVYARTFLQTLSNFSLAGPYLKLALGF